MTGVGFKDCKTALDETRGDLEKSIEFLRKKGIAKASKKMSRTASEGLALVKEEEGQVAIIEINSETDFVAKNSVALQKAGAKRSRRRSATLGWAPRALWTHTASAGEEEGRALVWRLHGACRPARPGAEPPRGLELCGASRCPRCSPTIRSSTSSTSTCRWPALF